MYHYVNEEITASQAEVNLATQFQAQFCSQCLRLFGTRGAAVDMGNLMQI